MRANRRRALMRERLLGARDDNGFSLIESIVALVIAGGVLAAMSISLLQTARASVTARQSQQATDVMNEQLEYVRSLDYSKATEIKSDLAGDSNLTYNAGTDTYYLSTSAGQEPVVAGTVGLITNHIQQVTRQNTTYTVYTYITQVADTVKSTSDYRRVTVIATWDIRGVKHTRRSSTFFTDTRRGLPLPRFTITSSQAIKTNVGATLAIAFTITNVGAPDAFNLTATAPPSGTWSWYTDGANGDGSYCATATQCPNSTPDAALTDTDGDTNGYKDTGIMQTGQSRIFYAVRTIAVGEPTAQSVTITATSAAQPTASTATNGLSVSILVNPASCSGCTFVDYYLHNSATYPGDTPYQLVQGNQVVPMQLNTSPPAVARTVLYNYSNNCSTSTYTDCLTVPYGRHVALGGSPGPNDPPRAPAWYYQVPVSGNNPATYKGTASITIWAQNATPGGPTASITAYVGADQNGSGSFKAAGSGTATVPGGTGWNALIIGIPLNIASGLDASGSLSTTKNIAVQIVVSGANVRLAYDTQTYNAFVEMPRTSSCPAGVTLC